LLVLQRLGKLQLIIPSHTPHESFYEKQPNSGPHITISPSNTFIRMPFYLCTFCLSYTFVSKAFHYCWLPHRTIRIQANGEGEIERKEELLNGTQPKAYYGGRESKRETLVEKRSVAGSMVDDDGNYGESSGEDSDLVGKWVV